MQNSNEIDPTNLRTCILVITRNKHAEILTIRDNGKFRLPRIEIPRWERPASHLTREADARWEIEAICLFRSKLIGQPAVDCDSFCFAIEARTVRETAHADTVWLSVGEALGCSAMAVGDAGILCSAICEARGYQSVEVVARFVRAGWFEELTSWVADRLSFHALCLTGPWAQYTMGPDFSLFRFQTSAAPVWFKAVGGINSAEFAITRELARIKSRFLPIMLGQNIEWRGWLTSEAPGHRLDETWNLRDWEAAAASLAALQIESIPIADILLAAGCRDVRVSQLATMIDPFLSVIADLMAAQSSSPPHILTNADLFLIATQLREGCNQLQCVGLPPCLGHGDLNPGNVLVDGGHAVILDWAQATVGHPFYACEYLLAVLRRLRPDLECWTSSILIAYLRPWREICSSEQIQQSLEWMTLMAPFAYALQVLTLCSGGDGTGGYAAKLLRSLARRLHDESVGRSKRLVSQS
jgi:hypothetical protein